MKVGKYFLIFAPSHLRIFALAHFCIFTLAYFCIFAPSHLQSLLKYSLAARITLGASIIAEIMAGKAINP
jgi:hypothetical protein